MNKLRVTAGTGRLSRAGRIIVFSLEPDPELHGLRPEPGGDIFKALATLIVTRNFEVPSFAAVDLEANALFVFGDIEVLVDGGPISGANSATWTERPFRNGAQIESAGMTSELADTDLVEGCVPASAFGLNVGTSRAGTPSDTAVTAADLVNPSVLADPGISLDMIGTPHAASAATIAEQLDSFDGDVTEEPEPEAARAQPEPAGAEPEPAGAEPEPAGAAPDLAAAQPRGPAELAPGSENAAAPFRAPPPVAPLRSNPAARQARLVCGNGRTALVTRGLLVGRFPGKHGVPDGYETLKVAGGEISRVHLLFVVEDDGLYVQDQNTSNGSTLVSAQRAVRPVPTGSGRLAIEPGDAIEFGDQVMTFQGWEPVASA